MAAGRWRSLDLPQAQRAEAARAMLSAVHLPWSLTLSDRARYDCALTWHDLGGCSLIECRSAPLAGYRDTRDLRRTEGDHVGLLLVLKGQERVRQGGAATLLRPGDMMLWDGSQPIEFEVMSPLHKVTMLVPRDRLGRALATGAPRGAMRLESRSGLGTLAAGHLAALARVAGDLPPGDAPLAADMLVDMLGRLVSPGPAAASGDLLSRILAHVDANLPDPALTPSRIASRFDISPRYLHMLFSATGTTLSAHIRTRRLAAMRRDLADPRLSARSITEIALNWGFCHGAHASRAFNATFGQSPSLFRAGQRR